MTELWRKTAKLFVKYPILWLPYVCSHLLNDALDLLRRGAAMPLFHWLSTRHSVLGGAPVQIYSEVARSRAFWILGVTEWSLRYLKICIDATALVVTAALVTMILRGEQPRLRAALAELRSYPKRILGYAFKLYFLDLAFTTFVSLPALRLSHWIGYSAATRGWSRVAHFALMQGQSPVSIILFAWIMTPITIRLLRAPSAELPSADEKKIGQYFVILTSFGAFALSRALFPLLFKLVVNLHTFPEQAYASLLSLVLSFPSLLGGIGVVLIAAGGNWNIGEALIPEKWRERVRVLMPLHFDGREER